jgi:5-methylcytosine-specific restriction endonuclease McrA
VSSVIPKDKFGRPIYPSTFAVLRRNGDIVIREGYRESVQKPNLFLLTLSEGVLFTDMRSTDIVPIWSDTRPALYWIFKEDVPMWKRRRIIKNELLRLHKAGCACRFHFYMDDTDEFVGVWLTLDYEGGVLECPDGFCRQCGKDFQGEGDTCSEECDKKYSDSFKKACAACGLKMEYAEEVRHHTSYFPENIVLVHRSCHNRIHHTQDFPALRPKDEDITRFYRSRSEVKRKRIGPLDDYV